MIIKAPKKEKTKILQSRSFQKMEARVYCPNCKKKWRAQASLNVLLDLRERHPLSGPKGEIICYCGECIQKEQKKGLIE